MIKRYLLLFFILTLLGCSNGERSRKYSITYNNRNARHLYQRARDEVEKKDFAPAINDILHAEHLCNNEDLKIKINNFKADLFNHIQIFNSIEKPATLKYTLLYNKDNAFYPIENMHIKFTFLEGEGIITESVNTNTYGTAISKIEKITSMKRKVIVEAVPIIHIQNDMYRIYELKRNFVFSRKSTTPDDSEIDILKDIIIDSVNTSLDFIGDLIHGIFRREDSD